MFDLNTIKFHGSLVDYDPVFRNRSFIQNHVYVYEKRIYYNLQYFPYHIIQFLFHALFLFLDSHRWNTRVVLERRYCP